MALGSPTATEHGAKNGMPASLQVSTTSPLDEYARRHGQFNRPSAVPPALSSCVSGLPPTARVLDLGCGEAGTLVALERSGSPSLFGLEGSMLRASIAASRTGACLVVAVGETMPFVSGSFDLLILRHVIEHVEDDERLLAEIRRVLRLGGQLFVETPLRLAGAWYIYKNAAGVRVLDPTHAREYRAVDDLLEKIRRQRFEVRMTEVTRIRFPVRELWARVERTLPGHRPQSWHAPSRWMIPVPRYREIRSVCQAV